MRHVIIAGVASVLLVLASIVSFMSSSSSSSSSSSPSASPPATTSVLTTTSAPQAKAAAATEASSAPLTLPPELASQLECTSEKQQLSDGPCVTYDERYALCRYVRDHAATPQQLHGFFQQFAPSATTQQQHHEIVLLRIHRRTSWAGDFWLSTCALITESALRCRRRVVVLFTLSGHEDSVPAEFQNFVRTHDEAELERVYTKEIYTGGYTRGDLAAAHFLLKDDFASKFDFAWLVENDIRYAGRSWDDYFRNSRLLGRMRPDSALDAAELERLSKEFALRNPLGQLFPLKQQQMSEKEGGSHDDAHLLYPYPPIRNRPGRFIDDEAAAKFANRVYPSAAFPFPLLVPPPNTWIMARRDYWRGSWSSLMAPGQQAAARANLSSSFWVGALVPLFGFSRTLAAEIVVLSRRGDGHHNQEVVAPVTAQLHRLKQVSTAGWINSQFYFSWGRAYNKTKETAPLYLSWMMASSSSSSSISPRAARLYGINTWQFAGKKCLAGVIFHPVKL